MISDIQREVAVHLLANALRRLRAHETRPARDNGDAAEILERPHGRRNPDEEYIRGMIDMLRALCGKAYTDDLLRAARALERSASTR
jgi:hypothetical protein